MDLGTVPTQLGSVGETPIFGNASVAALRLTRGWAATLGPLRARRFEALGRLRHTNSSGRAGVDVGSIPAVVRATKHLGTRAPASVASASVTFLLNCGVVPLDYHSIYSAMYRLVFII